MCIVPVFVGLDYHQDSVQVCILDSTGKRLENRAVDNTVERVEQAICRYGTPRRIAIEACCGAADLAEQLATERNLPVQLAHPGYVSRMKRSPDKTDLSDAQLLADLVRVNYLPRVWLAPQAIRELRRLVRYRASLVRQRKDVKLRIRGLLRENRLRCLHARAWTKRWHAWLLEEAALSESDRWLLKQHLALLGMLAQQIDEAELRLEEAVAHDPVVAKLRSFHQVGLVTAATLRAEVGRFDRFDTGKQLSRFCGVTPRNASSGTRQADAGLIKAGNPGLRQVLIELSHRLIRSAGSSFCKLAAGMLKRGKPKNVVVAAVANRWVRWLYYQVRSEVDPTATSTKSLPQTPASGDVT